jgi:hypothetical protein
MTPGCAIQRGQTVEGSRMIGIGRESSLVGAARFVVVAQLLLPDLTEVRLEDSPFVGGHLRLALQLGNLQHEVPLLGALVDAAELAEGGAVARLHPGQLPIDLARRLEIEDPLFEDLPESAEQGRLQRRIGLHTGRGQALPVQLDERLPLALEEVMLLECLEGTAIVRVADEDPLLRVETGGQGFLVCGGRLWHGAPRASIDRQGHRLNRRFGFGFAPSRGGWCSRARRSSGQPDGCQRKGWGGEAEELGVGDFSCAPRCAGSSARGAR